MNSINSSPPKRINWYFFLRLALGLLFITSGGEKILSHHQNFLYVVQSYNILPTPGESIFSYIFPWIEFIVGVFLLLGLWLDVSIKAALVFFMMFIFVVGQAIVRKLPITECGCFGELISFPLPVILTFDSCMFLLTVRLLLKQDQAQVFSLDQSFAGK